MRNVEPSEGQEESKYDRCQRRYGLKSLWHQSSDHNIAQSVSIHERLFDDIVLSELITISLTRMRIDQLNPPEPKAVRDVSIASSDKAPPRNQEPKFIINNNILEKI